MLYVCVSSLMTPDTSNSAFGLLTYFEVRRKETRLCLNKGVPLRVLIQIFSCLFVFSLRYGAAYILITD